MDSVVRVKPGVEFTVIAPGGFRILAALVAVAESIGHDITITSACDGAHSGPDDPHHLGMAYDIRIHDLPDPSVVLQDIQLELGVMEFYAFIEDEGLPNQHIHCQVKEAVEYP
jgi:hypothetical protein